MVTILVMKAFTFYKKPLQTFVEACKFAQSDFVNSLLGRANDFLNVPLC